MSVAPSWWPDPYGRSPARWWDGSQWTGYVYVNGAVTLERGEQPAVDPSAARPTSEPSLAERRMWVRGFIEDQAARQVISEDLRVQLCREVEHWQPGDRSPVAAPPPVVIAAPVVPPSPIPAPPAAPAPPPVPAPRPVHTPTPPQRPLPPPPVPRPVHTPPPPQRPLPPPPVPRPVHTPPPQRPLPPPPAPRPAYTPPAWPVSTPAAVTPSRLRIWWDEHRAAVSADLALHGLAYLGVLLVFVGLFGLVVFAFGGVAPRLRPVAEAAIPLTFFGGGAFLRSRRAPFRR